MLERTFEDLRQKSINEGDIIEMRLNAISVYEELRLQAQVDHGLIKLDNAGYPINYN